jgi:hypothetical protein
VKPLFDADEEWSEDGRVLDGEVADALRPIFKKWMDKGYSLRHIHHIVLHAAFEAGLMAHLDYLE